MSADLGPLAQPIASALEELQRHRLRGEAFARAGETELLRRDAAGAWETRRNSEAGIACRVAGGGRAGFAAVSGGGARAGHEAARTALAAAIPAPDPLPPRRLLGVTPVPPPAAGGSAERREAFANALVGAVERDGEVSLVELRVLEGRATSALATGEGFVARWDSAGALVELLLAPEDGPWRLVSTAVPSLRELDVKAVAERALGAARLARSGAAPPRQLADILLAPSMAAPLVAALARHLSAGSDELAFALAHGRVSPIWRLEDHRAGPGGLLPAPCDGEGLPARTIVLLAGGHTRERYVMWRDADDLFGNGGGAVRRSYREPPGVGPANLVVSPVRALSQPGLLAALDRGFYLACPAGGVFVDQATGRFAVRSAAVSILHGKAVATHPLVELRGSLKRLLTGLAATGADLESFSLDCAVTTPSLLVHRLEIA